jgi:hypothetical protein
MREVYVLYEHIVGITLVEVLTLLCHIRHDSVN